MFRIVVLDVPSTKVRDAVEILTASGLVQKVTETGHNLSNGGLSSDLESGWTTNAVGSIQNWNGIMEAMMAVKKNLPGRVMLEIG